MSERNGRYYVVRFDDDLIANDVTVRLFEAASGARATDRMIVWASSPWATQRELFLSADALTLARQAGLGLRVDREIDHAELPAIKALLIGDASDAERG